MTAHDGFEPRTPEEQDAPRKPRRSCIRKIFLRSVAAVLVIFISLFVWNRIGARDAAVSIEGSERAALRSFDGHLRVGAYNIAHGRGPALDASNWSTTKKRRLRLRAIGKAIRELDLDIVILNEVDFDAVWSGHEDQAAVIAEEAGIPFIVRQRNLDLAIPFVRLRFGNAILSRHPVRSAELVALPPHSSIEHRIAGSKQSVAIVVELPDGTDLSVWAIHLESRSAKTRLASARAIIRHTAASPLPVLLAGDFNAAAHSTETTAVDLFLATDRFQLAPTPPAPTFPTVAPVVSIDWILAPAEWTPVASEVIDLPFSDHLPVVAEFRLP